MIRNQEIRNALYEAKMYQWELAKEMGINESTLTRKLREELPQDEKNKMLSIIESYSKAKGV